MPQGTNPISPLPADPRRQATEMLRAVAYQLWQSVLAWVCLGPEEVLFLEGAEDFDLVGPAGAAAVQVFDSTRRISLRTPKVLAALGNYWQLRASSGSREVQFRFLTRAGAAVEEGEPFGADVAGLTLWGKRRLDDEKVRLLATFIADQAVPNDLRAFLRSAPPDRLRDEFFERVFWDLGAPTAATVERTVQEKLAVLGEKLELTFSEAGDTRHRFFSEVFDVASQRGSDRALNRAKLLEMFEREAFVRVSRRQYAALSRGFASDHGDAALSRARGSLRFGLPPLPSVTEERAGLVVRLHQRLDVEGVLVLVGSSGMGKSTLSKLLAGQNSSDVWHWASFADQTATEVSRALRDLNVLLDHDPSIRNLVLDDLNLPPEAARAAEEPLAGLICRLRQARGRLLISGHREPDARLASNGWLPASATFRVPVLDVSELRGLARGLGCTDGARAETWADLAGARTLGHPQLARAFLAAIADQGWPEPSSLALAIVPASLEEHHAAARQFLGLLPEAERELAYRLSVLTRPFRRDHVLNIGARIPNVPAPGAAFDRLRGSWIDPLRADYFRMSPLLEGAADRDYPAGRVRGFHLDVARAMCECEPRTHLEAGSAFRHAWLAKSEKALMGLMEGFMAEDRRNFAGIAAQLIWFVAEGPKGSFLYPANRTLSNILRALQARVAVEIDVELAAEVFAAWHEELFILDPANDLMSKFLLISQASLSAQLHVPAGRLVEYFRLYAEAQRTLPDMPPMDVPDPERVYGSVMAGVTDPLAHMGILLVPRSESVAFLEELLTALDGVDEALRERIFAGLRRLPVETRLLLDKVWLQVSEQLSPDWPPCLAVLRRAADCAQRWGWPELAVAAVRAVAMVLDENLHDQEAALAEIVHARTLRGLNSHLLDSEEATVRFHRGQHREALALWERAFARWPPAVEPHDTYAALSARLAGMAAAAVGDWKLAGDWFGRGRQSLPPGYDRPLAAGLLADAAFAYWRANAPADCVRAFGDALAIVERLPPGKGDLRSFRTRKGLGHVLLWVCNSVHGSAQGDPRAEPQAGWCSYPEADERLRELPEGNPDALPWLLLRLAVRLGQEAGLLEWLKPRLENSSSPSVRAGYHHALLHRALLRADLGGLVQIEHATRQVMFAAIAAGQAVGGNLPPLVPPGTESFPRHVSGVGSDVFLAAMLVLAGSGLGCLHHLDTWRRAARELHDGSALELWLGEVEEGFAQPLSVAEHLLQQGDAPSERLHLAALQVASATACAPTALLRAHCFLLHVVPGSAWSFAAADPLATLVTQGWRRAARSRMLLLAPNLHVPKLLAACDDPEGGIRKAASIILAAIPAVTTRASPGLIEQIRRHVF